MADDNVAIAKEVRKRPRTALEEYSAAARKKAGAWIDDIPKEKLKEMMAQPEGQGQATANEGAIQLATGAEAKLIVEDMSRKLGILGSLILVFKDRTGRMHPYLGKEAMGMIVERKGYGRIDYAEGKKHAPDQHRYHYECRITPNLTDAQVRALALVKDVDREAFMKEYRRLTDPIVDDGYASPETVRMSTMKSDYNLERLAKTRAYRHVVALYTGAGFGVVGAVAEQAEELETAGAIDAQESPPG